jgi:hypothetical protein
VTNIREYQFKGGKIYFCSRFQDTGSTVSGTVMRPRIMAQGSGGQRCSTPREQEAERDDIAPKCMQPVTYFLQLSTILESFHHLPILLLNFNLSLD